MAYEIWEKMEELSSKLWDRYFKEFIEIILDEEDVGYDDQHDENVGKVDF
jgi:hypothetical protein